MLGLDASDSDEEGTESNQHHPLLPDLLHDDSDYDSEPCTGSSRDTDGVVTETATSASVPCSGRQPAQVIRGRVGASWDNNSLIIIAFKGAIRDFSQSPLCAANHLQHVRSSGPGAITCNTSSASHVQHVVLRARWYEGTVQLLSLTEFKSHFF